MAPVVVDARAHQLTGSSGGFYGTTNSLLLKAAKGSLRRHESLLLSSGFVVCLLDMSQKEA